MQPLRRFCERTVVLPINNIDTDQIIPARFLKVTTRSGLGRWAFADWRYDAQSQPRPDFVLNRPDAKGCRILVAGDNFGCGSSREHAPWALLDFGFRAVISTSIADIFTNNALKNRLVPIVLPAPIHRYLLDHPGLALTVDLEQTELEVPGREKVKFPMDPFVRYCLMNGLDELSFLTSAEADVLAYESSRAMIPAKVRP